jgi:phosphoserine aminotransferase
VVEEVRDNLVDFDGTGLGAMEYSHRSKRFERVLATAKERMHRLLGLADDQEVLFVHGGAKSQFFFVPMNLLNGGHATYLDTGLWAQLAEVEAARYGSANVPFSSKASNYNRVPKAGEWGALPEGTSYLHYTSNNTVAGTQYHYLPDSENVPLICDMSSDILSRKVDGSAFDLIYAGAQKNLGPSGLCVVIVRKSLLERCSPDLPPMLSYAVYAKKDSMYNTPNTWAIYVMERVLAWIEDQGLAAVEARNIAQATRFYDAVDATEFWTGLADVDSRSHMTPTFSAGTPELDTEFWQWAEQGGLVGLKGHRSLGGLRASMYNAQTDAAVDALISAMQEFERMRG